MNLAKTMNTPPKTPSSESRKVKIRSLSDFNWSLSETWQAIHSDTRIHRSAVPPMAAAPVQSMNAWPTGDRTPFVTSADFIPVSVITGMPAHMYPKYMRFLVRCTLATMQVTTPHVQAELTDATFLRIVTLATAVRCGVWAAMAVVPAAPTTHLATAVAYDSKRQRLWLRRATDAADHDAWLAAFTRADHKVKNAEEIMDHTCVVAPMFMCMGATALTQRGEVYAAPYVERSVSSCLKLRMGKGAYADLRLDSDLVWDTLKTASVTGLPASAVRSWATDPLVAVGAQKRISTSMRETERYKVREAALMAGSTTPASVMGVDDTDDEDQDAEDPLVAEIRKMKAAAGDTDPDDDGMTAPTSWGADLSRPATPDAQGPTVVPTRSPSPVPTMGQSHRDQIRAAIMHAAASGPRAASEVAGALEDDTVRW